MTDVARYRLLMMNRPIAPWRATLQDAQADAICAGAADWDLNLRALFILVPARIVHGEGPPVPPRPVEPEPAPRTVRRRTASHAAGRRRPPAPTSR